MSSSSSSSQNEITGHYGHLQHELVRAEKDAMIHTCKDCKDQILGLGSSYKCTDCNEYLHEACRNAKPNSTHPYPFSPNLPLKFSTAEIEKLKFSTEKGGTTRIHCTSCCSYIEGIMFTGCQAKKNYSLHPQCLELSPNFGRVFECKGMNSALELERFPTMPTNWICFVCGTNDDKGWCYSIKSNGESKFACHVRCLKERVAKDWYRTMIPLEMADRKQYFKSRCWKYLEKFTSGLALEVVAVGLDLMVSAFVGGPFVSIISAGLGVSVHFALKKL